jgi:NTE family protein
LEHLLDRIQARWHGVFGLVLLCGAWDPILPELKRPIFGIFEGGGAKGIAHLGALEAAEKNGLEFIGVAGASAGAFVAALIAAGYRAHDLMDPDGGTHILQRHDMSPIDLLGRGDWKRFSRFIANAGWLAGSIAIGGLLVGRIVCPRASSVFATIRRQRGYLSLEPLRICVNKLLRDRLLDLYADAGRPPKELPQRVRFCDLNPALFPQLRPLKIVVTDLATKQLLVFDRELTPNAEIAEVVAASAAIPFVFKPVTMVSHAGGPFVDGGLASNLPIWLFAEEKLAFERANPSQPRVPIIGFTLNQALPDNGTVGVSTGFFDFASVVMETAIFSGQSISQRFIEDLHIVTLTTELSTLDFDAGWNRACDAYIAGRRCAAERLRATLQIKPERVRAELKRICDGIRARIVNLRMAKSRQPVTYLRANLCEKFGSSSLRITHAYNMENDADDRLLLDRRGRGAPKAFIERTAVLVQLGTAAANDANDYMTKYERALLRPQMRSAICIPVFRDVRDWAMEPKDRPEPIGVLCVDSDDDLSAEFADENFIRLLAEESVVLSLAFGAE